MDPLFIAAVISGTTSAVMLRFIAMIPHWRTRRDESIGWRIRSFFGLKSPLFARRRDRSAIEAEKAELRLEQMMATHRKEKQKERQRQLTLWDTDFQSLVKVSFQRLYADPDTHSKLFPDHKVRWEPKLLDNRYDGYSRELEYFICWSCTRSEKLVPIGSLVEIPDGYQLHQSVRPLEYDELEDHEELKSFADGTIKVPTIRLNEGSITAGRIAIHSGALWEKSGPSLSEKIKSMESELDHLVKLSKTPGISVEGLDKIISRIQKIQEQGLKLEKDQLRKVSLTDRERQAIAEQLNEARQHTWWDQG